MMPSIKVQGQSEAATEQKQRGLTFAFRIGLAVINKFPRYRYFHFDLHAGSGFNDEAGCVGSPLAFWNEADRTQCQRFFAAFCDRDEAAAKALLKRPQLQDKRCWVFHGDNAELLSIAPDIILRCGEKLKYAIGSVLSDPNGADVPIEALAWLAETCPKIDLIFHWNSTITKRLSNGIKPEQIVLQDVPNLIRKAHWLIREPLGPHQFTMLIGRNFQTNDWKSVGFHHLDSPQGQSILERCSLSRRVLVTRSQDDLFHASL